MAVLGAGLAVRGQTRRGQEPGGGAADADGERREQGRVPAGRCRKPPGAAGSWPAQAVANAALGGEGVLDLASAFATGGLFGVAGWSPEACAAAGVAPGQLPRVAVFGEAVGKVDLPGALMAGAGQAPLEGTVLGAGSVDRLCGGSWRALARTATW